MKAIQARFYGATNFKGERIKVWAEGNKPVWYAMAYEQNDGGMKSFILDYADKRGWLPRDTAMAYGTLPNGDKVGVFVPR